MIRKAETADVEQVLQITGETISEIYSHYYAKGVVDFFQEHHCRENVLADIENGRVWLLETEGVAAGTVTIKENAVNRLFVLPKYQSHGYGSELMDFAEIQIAEIFDFVHIDSSLAAKEMYLKRGYKETKTCKIMAGNGDILIYDEMEKPVARTQSGINDNGKIFERRRNMFWDKVSGVYDLVETIYNGKVYRALGARIAQEIGQSDIVLECACGTGAISRYLAPKCKKLIATDFSRGMLKQTSKNCRKFNNITKRRADMTQLKCRDNRFDEVVAGNVIHLLEEPYAAIKELERVCKPGGKIIVPTYINASNGVNKRAVRLLELAGVNFKRQFDIHSYRKFFEDAGYENVSFDIVDGRMPCALAVITKPL